MNTGTQIGRGGGGGGHGGGGHGGGGHGHGGRGGGRWRGGFGGGWYGPGVYDVVPSYGFEIDDVLDEEDRHANTKELASQIAHHLKHGGATVGEDLDMLGADLLGDDKGKDSKSDDKKPSAPSSFLSSINPASWLEAGGSLFQTGLNIYEKEDAENKANAKAAAEKTKTAADESRKLQAAILADVIASQATAVAVRSAAQKLPSAAIDAAAAKNAQSAQMTAGAAGLSADSISKRVDAAQKQLATATAAAQRDPKNVYNKALMDAWMQTMNRIQNAQITGPSGGALVNGGGKGDGWLSGKTGPVPNVAIAGAGVVGGLAFLVKKLLIK